jgi:hypothetical protein
MFLSPTHRSQKYMPFICAPLGMMLPCMYLSCESQAWQNLGFFVCGCTMFAPPVLYILPPNFLYSPPTSALYHPGSILSSSSNSERTVVRTVRLRIGVRPAIFEINQRLLE